MDTEDQGVKVFLISVSIELILIILQNYTLSADREHAFLLSLKASSKDTGQLFAAIHHRILALRSRVEQESETKCPEPVREVAQCNEEDSDDDDVLTPAVTTTFGKYTWSREAIAKFSV